MGPTQSDASAKWQGAGCGAHYQRERFGSPRAQARDWQCLRSLLERCAGEIRVERLLDVPCGSGRLTRALAARADRYVGVDVSRTMLESALPALREAGSGALLLEARGERLPFPDDSFDVVVACRWLHHLHGDDELEAAVRELVRVSRGWVLASFWDARSLPGLRRRLGLKRPEGARGRVARSRDEIARAFAGAGADPAAWRSSLRFVSQQTFVAAQVRGARA